MNSVEIKPEHLEGAIPLPGRILLEIEAKPEMIGAIHVPDVARDKTLSDTAQLARVVAVGYGAHYFLEGRKMRRFTVTPEDLKPGDRVAFRALANELNKRYVLTDARRVDAVVEG